MITKVELRRIAEQRNLSVESAEKNYLLELLLFQIYSEYGDLLILKGGTSLYKLYGLNRFSEDLDFTVNKRRFDTEAIIGKLLRRLSSIGIDGRVNKIEHSKNEINIRLYLKGPLYDGRKQSLCPITLNISRRERVLIEPKKEFLIPSSKELPSFNLFVMDENEIAAEKVRAIMTRDKARDVYDLWFLIKRGIIPDINLIDRKLELYDLTFSPHKFIDAINKKKKSWHTDLKGLVIGDLIDFKKVKDEILSALIDKQS